MMKEESTRMQLIKEHHWRRSYRHNGRVNKKQSVIKIIFTVLGLWGSFFTYMYKDEILLSQKASPSAGNSAYLERTNKTQESVSKDEGKILPLRKDDTFTADNATEVRDDTSKEKNPGKNGDKKDKMPLHNDDASNNFNKEVVAYSPASR